MHHVAILEKKYFNKIISGEKTIESRWTYYPKEPYKQVNIGETIYLKESGKKVAHKAKVADTLFKEGLTPRKIKALLKKYHKNIGVEMSYFKNVKKKRYCSLVFLKDIKQIPQFNIDRKGFNPRAAWITVKNINKIKKKI